MARKVFSNLTDEALHIAHDVYLTNGGNEYIVVLCLLPVMLRGVSYRKNKWVILSEYNFCLSVQTINSFGWLSEITYMAGCIFMSTRHFQFPILHNALNEYELFLFQYYSCILCIKDQQGNQIDIILKTKNTQNINNAVCK